MHVRPFCLSLGVLSLVAPALSQAPAPQQPAVRQPDGPLNRTIRRPDGGVSEPMQSIFVPPKPGAPFSLTLAAEWSRPMANGGSFRLANERHIVRDSKGRIYQERWILVPKGGKIKSEMNVFQITDPDEHTWHNCDVRAKICELLQYTLTTQRITSRQPALPVPFPTAAASAPMKISA